MKRLLAFTTLQLMFSALAAAQTRPRIAVFPLEFGTVKTEAAAIFGTNSDAGKGIADLIVDGLLKEGKFDIFERSQLTKVLSEQDLGLSNRADAASAAAFGKVIGVQAVVIGSITKLGKEDSGFGPYKNTKAAISLTVRVVDAATSQVLFSTSGSGQASRRGVTLSNPQGNQVAFGSSFKELVIGEATIKAVDQLVDGLNSQVQKFPAAATAPAVTSNPKPVAETAKGTTTATPAPNGAPLTATTIGEMLSSGVPESQVIEIIQGHPNMGINPLDPSWAIMVARQRISLALQNAVRSRAGLEPLATPAPAKPPASAKPAAPKPAAPKPAPAKPAAK